MRCSGLTDYRSSIGAISNSREGVTYRSYSYLSTYSTYAYHSLALS
jgi:hypothetical protein